MVDIVMFCVMAILSIIIAINFDECYEFANNIQYRLEVYPYKKYTIALLRGDNFPLQQYLYQKRNTSLVFTKEYNLLSLIRSLYLQIPKERFNSKIFLSMVNEIITLGNKFKYFVDENHCYDFKLRVLNRYKKDLDMTEAVEWLGGWDVVNANIKRHLQNKDELLRETSLFGDEFVAKSKKAKKVICE